MTATALKGAYSADARRRQLDASNKPHRILWSYCASCQRGRYFYDIRRFALKRGEKARVEPGMIKVAGLCMTCGTRDEFYSDEEELTAHRYSPAEICMCGFPAYHHDPPTTLRRNYSIAPVSCRPSRNGHGSP